jgi:hypothetical protein
MDDGAGALPRGGIQEITVARRPRAQRDKLTAVAFQDVGERIGGDRAAGRRFELQELRVIACVERRGGVHAGHEHAVAHDAVQGGIGPGRERRGVHPRDRREHRVAVGVLGALVAKPRDRRRVTRVDAVRPQAVDDEDGNEFRRRGRLMSARDDAEDGNDETRDIYSDGHVPGSSVLGRPVLSPQSPGPQSSGVSAHALFSA